MLVVLTPMRLDKFLQTSRIVKRRAVATELCNRGRVDVNDRPAKAGRALLVGDTLTLSFGSDGKLVCRVLDLPTRGIRKEEAAGLYEVVSDTRSGSPQDS
jgi:ribosomal 50S subunit-recycling heat shock protein